jgi:hypothetical protein
MKTKSNEILYNGITLSKKWPPRNLDDSSWDPMPVPYLENTPKDICIDVGRQLFVDDFLIEDTTLARCFHKAKLHEINPVLKPETSMEMNEGKLPVASLFNDGVWYDPYDKLFKMWYHAGWYDGIAYAVSEDGIHWRRPMLDVVLGTNRVIQKQYRNGVVVWLDHETANPMQRFKMFHWAFPSKNPDEGHGVVSTSHDGIHWSEPVDTGHCGDNTTAFYNPFRKKWVFSIRKGNRLGRVRYYYECDDFMMDALWPDNDTVFWTRTDSLDLPNPELGNWNRGNKLFSSQLYDLNAVAYESIMLGLFAIIKGYDNEVVRENGFPKLNDLYLGYSRDGFHWHRPDRSSFIASSARKDTWNRGYLHAAGGICLIVHDELYFYFGAWSGNSPVYGSHRYAGGSTGLAVLRRDGFTSMNSNFTMGSLTTKPVIFNRGKYLFVNINSRDGVLRAEILDVKGNVIGPFSVNNCMSISKDSTCQMIFWKDEHDLSRLKGQPVKFRFYLTNGQLYSFWVSPDANAASYGYTGAGGPGFSSNIDTGF